MELPTYIPKRGLLKLFLRMPPRRKREKHLATKEVRGNNGFLMSHNNENSCRRPSVNMFTAHLSSSESMRQSTRTATASSWPPPPPSLQATGESDFAGNRQDDGDFSGGMAEEVECCCCCCCCWAGLTSILSQGVFSEKVFSLQHFFSKTVLSEEASIGRPISEEVRSRLLSILEKDGEASSPCARKGGQEKRERRGESRRSSDHRDPIGGSYPRAYFKITHLTDSLYLCGGLPPPIAELQHASLYSKYNEGKGKQSFFTRPPGKISLFRTRRLLRNSSQCQAPDACFPKCNRVQGGGGLARRRCHCFPRIRVRKA